MSENFTQKSYRLPDGLLEALENEASSQTRNSTQQLIHILTERYKSPQRLEDKQRRGGLRK